MCDSSSSIFLEEDPCAHALITSQIHKFCDGCLVESAKLFCCSSCKTMRYCSRSCQKSMWTSHKLECARCKIVGKLPVAEVRLVIRLLNMKNSDQMEFKNLVTHAREIANDTDLMDSFITFRSAYAGFVENSLLATDEDIFLTFCRPHINYVDCMATMKERREKLRRYFFECNCTLCLDVERERHITALECCTSIMLSEEIAISQLPTLGDQNKYCFELIDRSNGSSSVRYCPKCLKVYDTRLILDIQEHLAGSVWGAVSIEANADALILHHRIAGITGSLDKFQLLTLPELQSKEQTLKLNHAYHRLFGHSDNLYFARNAHRAGCVTDLTTFNRLLTILRKQHSISSNIVLDTILACSIDLLEWRLKWLPSDRLILGQHAFGLAGALLSFITDSKLLTCPERMNQVKQYMIFHKSDATRLPPTLGHVLCKASRLACEILGPLAVYRPNWKDGLSVLEHYRDQELSY